MIRYTEHTRRKAGGKCDCCSAPIEVGERYRWLVVLNDESFDDGFTKQCMACAPDDWPLDSASQPPPPDFGAVVRRWNEAHPVGTPVRYWTGAKWGAGEVGTVREAAYVLGGHTPCAFVTGHPACIALTHIEAAS